MRASRRNFVMLGGGAIDHPVGVRIVSRTMHEFPALCWSSRSNVAHVKGGVVYDAPIVLADNSRVAANA